MAWEKPRNGGGRWISWTEETAATLIACELSIAMPPRKEGKKEACAEASEREGRRGIEEEPRGLKSLQQLYELAVSCPWPCCPKRSPFFFLFFWKEA